MDNENVVIDEQPKEEVKEEVKSEVKEPVINEEELKIKLLKEIEEEQRRKSLTDEQLLIEDAKKEKEEYQKRVSELEKREKLIVLKEEFTKNSLNTDLLKFINIDNLKNDKQEIESFVKTFNEELTKVKDDAIKDFKTEYLKDKPINYKETKTATKKIKTAKDAVSQLFK